MGRSSVRRLPVRRKAITPMLAAEVEARREVRSDSAVSSAISVSMTDRLVTLRSKTAPVYQRLFPELFDRPEVVETRATCDTCAMCDQGQIAPVAMDYFRPDAKCCTWHPSLPNYLVGAILADTGEELAEGRRRLRAKIAARVGVTPQFIAPPRKYTALYAAARGAGFFGRSKVMLCPYFDEENNGRCTVWRYRESVCSTYFCKYTAGKPGFQFWDTLKGYLSLVEHALARYGAMTVDSTVTEPKVERYALTAEDIEDLPPSDADYARFWGNGKWVGREEEFYIACYERVQKLDKGDFEKHVDDTPDGRGLLAKLEAKYDDIANAKLPDVLIRTTNMKKREAGENVVVTSYNPYDAFSLEKELFDVLGMLRADQTLEENLARLDKEHDVQLAPELIHYLYVHGVLAAPEKKKAEEKPKQDDAGLGNDVGAVVRGRPSKAAAAAPPAKAAKKPAPAAKSAPTKKAAPATKKR
jgi:hypothetical protein